MLALREDTAAVVLPMRVIFLELISVSGIDGSLKGGFWRPSFDATRNFWLEGGMKSSVATRSDRSDIVASCRNDIATGFPWCVSVICTSSALATGEDGGLVSVMMGEKSKIDDTVKDWNMIYYELLVARVSCDQDV